MIISCHLCSYALFRYGSSSDNMQTKVNLCHLSKWRHIKYDKQDKTELTAILILVTKWVGKCFVFYMQKWKMIDRKLLHFVLVTCFAVFTLILVLLFCWSYLSVIWCKWTFMKPLWFHGLSSIITLRNCIFKGHRSWWTRFVNAYQSNKSWIMG